MASDLTAASVDVSGGSEQWIPGEEDRPFRDYMEHLHLHEIEDTAAKLKATKWWRWRERRHHAYWLRVAKRDLEAFERDFPPIR